MTGECKSCGSRRGETPFPITRRRNDPLLCVDCLAERVTLPRSSMIQRPTILTRAQWRARLAVRRASLQADLVDLACQP